jgi:hypothetical protein
MKRTRSINWHNSKTKQNLLTLEVPEAPEPSDPLVKVFPYQLTRDELAEFQAAVTDCFELVGLLETKPQAKEAAS